MPTRTTNMDGESRNGNSVSATRFADYWRTWSNILAASDKKLDDEFHRIFENFVSEGATYFLPHGLDKTEWADRVYDMARAYGFIERFGVDDLQMLMAQRIAATEAKVERVPDEIELPPRINGQAHGGPSHDEIHLVRAADVPMEKVDWLWSNHLARGKVTLLAGNTGLGKSQISYDLTARATKIGEWPDGDEAPIGNVVILSSEDAIKDTIVPRLAAAGADLNRVHCVACVKTDGVSRTFSLQVDLQRLGDKVREIGDVLLVI